MGGFQASYEPSRRSYYPSGIWQPALGGDAEHDSVGKLLRADQPFPPRTGPTRSGRGFSAGGLLPGGLIHRPHSGVSATVSWLKEEVREYPESLEGRSPAPQLVTEICISSIPIYKNYANFTFNSKNEIFKWLFYDCT